MTLGGDFQLPIEGRTHIDVGDDGLADLDPEGEDHLAGEVFPGCKTRFGRAVAPRVLRSYTADTAFLKDMQKLSRHEKSQKDVDAATCDAMCDAWEGVTSETSFLVAHHYPDWEFMQPLNRSAGFLQVLAVLDMSSPVLALLLPVFIAVIPFLIIRLRGHPCTVSQYVAVLKTVMERHNMGSLMQLRTSSLKECASVVGTLAFYVAQVYQNVTACRSFWSSMKKSHEVLCKVRAYLAIAVPRMNATAKFALGTRTLEGYGEAVRLKAATLQTFLDDLSHVEPWSANLQCFGCVGRTRKAWFILHQCKVAREALDYSFGFMGLCDCLQAVERAVKAGDMGRCKFVKSRPRLRGAYFPQSCAGKPIRNDMDGDTVVVTGPNASGKTTLLKAWLLSARLSQHVGAGFYKSARVAPYAQIHSYVNVPDSMSRDSLFQAEARRCKRVLTSIDDVPGRHLCVFDELFSGTNPEEAVATGVAFMEGLTLSGRATCVLTTHFVNLCDHLDSVPGVANMHMSVKRGDGGHGHGPTYLLCPGVSTVKGGVAVIRDMEFPKDMVARAEAVIGSRPAVRSGRAETM